MPLCGLLMERAGLMAPVRSIEQFSTAENAECCCDHCHAAVESAVIWDEPDSNIWKTWIRSQ